MTDEEHKWIETNNSVCALLRQAHDVLAMSSFPPRRTWVGLTDAERIALFEEHGHRTGALVGAVEDMLKEKNA
jgi:hypothetical protein